jgi:threonine dehydrogenase-like Zn-dependent dehydrogenase
MRAGVLAAPRHARVTRVEAPTPGPGEVLLRIEGCGVCGSNLPVWEGRRWLEYPLEPGAPGHEAWGRVEALGDGATGLEVGQLVTGLTYHSFAELDVASAEELVALPDMLAGRPFPGEPLGCAINVFRRSGIERGQTVAVVGIGFLGALIVQLAAAAEARVLALSRRSSALELARSCGADFALPLDAAIEDESCDVAVETAGVQETLDVAARLTRTRGRLVVAGYHQDGPRIIDLRLWNWRGLDVVNAHERDPAVYVAGIRAAVAAVAAGSIDPVPLCTHTVPLDRLDDALEMARTRPEGFVKALVVP